MPNCTQLIKVEDAADILRYCLSPGNGRVLTSFEDQAGYGLSGTMTQVNENFLVRALTTALEDGLEALLDKSLPQGGKARRHKRSDKYTTRDLVGTSDIGPRSRGDA